jgi:hypothetical protein
MAIMKQYKQGELPENMYGNETAKQGDAKGPSTLVVKSATALPADDYSETDVAAGRKVKNTVDKKVFSMADERDY